MSNLMVQPDSRKPILTISYLFPSDAVPIAGVFIRERIAHVAKYWPVIVISPQPWSPFDGLIRTLKNPKYRLQPTQSISKYEGYEVHRPRFFSLPGIGRGMAAKSMGSAVIRYIRKNIPLEFALIDSHFVYPEGVAARNISKALCLPYYITLRGERDTKCEGAPEESEVRDALQNAEKVISVSDDLGNFAKRLGTAPQQVLTIPNGVNLDAFYPVDTIQARRELGIDLSRPVLIAVGMYNLRKGHHRIVKAMPTILKQFPNALLLLVGGPGTSEDSTAEIRKAVKVNNLEDHVLECGQRTPDEIRNYFGAADVFVLATEHEGRANVMNEAAACGLPIVTTDVGGNREIVSNTDFGATVPFWDEALFCAKVCEFLENPGNTDARLSYAKNLTWTKTAQRVLETFEPSLDSTSTRN